MGDTFTTVVIGAVALFVLIGVVSTLTGPSVYDEIGAGGMSAGEGGSRGQGESPMSPELARAEREQEIRQMLGARSERLVRNGGEPLDIDAEIARLEAPATQGAAQAGQGAHDAGLAEEVRQLVLARNERRARSGEAPLDVEAEVARTLKELNPGGR